MNSNYEWQNFSARRRTDDYRRQAEVQRQLQANKGNETENDSAIAPVGFALLAGLVIIFIGFLLSGW